MKGYDDQFSPPDADGRSCIPTWDCPDTECGEEGNESEYCDGCGCPMPQDPDDDGSWEAEQAEKAYHDGSRYGTDSWMPRGDQ